MHQHTHPGLSFQARSKSLLVVTRLQRLPGGHVRSDCTQPGISGRVSVIFHDFLLVVCTYGHRVANHGSGVFRDSSGKERARVQEKTA